ncbi:hypothetical protein [Pseudanabaena sp. FACHB-2040]|uniref:hypothetical protein n=1 Tax=Pseudanabaena sp. FACHB-2040 TaxID=2692859 RepID=UPI0016899C7C|nr:hypothetical protein [Pseudanabaena sp. FACHB-2040]MBD2261121.1 hypothetical protein [Pseudanabaena sp. FACHB-2040]
MNISLGEFERRHGINKGTVSKKARELGFDTTSGLSPEAYKSLKQALNVQGPVTVPQVTVESGNHCTSLAVPEFGGMQIDLTQFRDSSSLVIDDPLAVAQQFLAVADTVITALDQDAAAREARLQQTRQAREAVTAKAQEMQLEQRLYRERARAADVATTAESQTLANALAQLQSLGKPAAPGAGQL